MKRQMLIAAAAALTAGVVIFSGTSAAAQQSPQYEVGGFPITPFQMLALQPSAKITEQQRLGAQRTMDASRRGYPDFGLAKSGW